jgi:hypothetical protein
MYILAIIAACFAAICRDALAFSVDEQRLLVNHTSEDTNAPPCHFDGQQAQDLPILLAHGDHAAALEVVVSQAFADVSVMLGFEGRDVHQSHSPNNGGHRAGCGLRGHATPRLSEASMANVFNSLYTGTINVGKSGKLILRWCNSGIQPKLQDQMGS